MRHQKGRKKLNVKPSHRRSLLRNQVTSFIVYGHLVSTKTNIKETKKLAEKVITIAREGNTFNARRRVQALLPYNDKAILKLFSEIAPRYTERPGGYTRIIPFGRRMSDGANIARLEWV